MTICSRHFLIALMSLIGASACMAEAPATPVVALTLEDENGARVSIPDPIAKATVLVFVTPECPIANRYAPALHALVDAYAGRVAFFRVYASPGQSRADARKHEAEYHFGCAGLLDPQQGAVVTCGATRTPEAVLLDAGGVVRYRGAIDDRYADLGKYRQTASREYVREAIDAVLNGKPVPTTQTDAVGCFIPAIDEKPTPMESQR